MKYTYKELKGLPEGVKTNLINGAGQKLNKLIDVDLDKLNLKDLDTTRLMSVTMAFKGLQIAFQAIDDYTDFIVAGIHEGALERSSELKSELEDMADVINTDLSNAYLKMVPYFMTDEEIQSIVDKGLTKKQQEDAILDKILGIINVATSKDAEVKEVGEDRKVKIISEQTIEKILDEAIEQAKEPQQEDNKEPDLTDLLRILFTSN